MRRHKITSILGIARLFGHALCGYDFFQPVSQRVRHNNKNYPTSKNQSVASDVLFYFQLKGDIYPDTGEIEDW
jgi:hypothetical protein